MGGPKLARIINDWQGVMCSSRPRKTNSLYQNFCFQLPPPSPIMWRRRMGWFPSLTITGWLDFGRHEIVCSPSLREIHPAGFAWKRNNVYPLKEFIQNTTKKSFSGVLALIYRLLQNLVSVFLKPFWYPIYEIPSFDRSLSPWSNSFQTTLFSQENPIWNPHSSFERWRLTWSINWR